MIMSQHIFETETREGITVTITVGYDRPLDFVFCTVTTQEDEVIYSNLDDDDAGTYQQDVDYYRDILERLELVVPSVVFEEVRADQLGHVGNRVVIHQANK
jgi:hypothetical protein